MRRTNFALAAMALAALLVGGCGSSGKNIDMGGLDLGKQLTGLLGQASGALSGITDASSARAALPTLQSVDRDLGQLAAKASEASPEQQQDLARIAGNALPDLETLIAQVNTIPGVSDVIGPAVGSITSKLSGLM